MNRFLALSIAGALLLVDLPPAFARSHRSKSDVTDKSAGSVAAPDSAAGAASAAPPAGSAAPLAAATGTVTVTGSGPAAGTGTISASGPVGPAAAAGTASAPAPPGAPPQYVLAPPQYALPPPQYALPPPTPVPVTPQATRTRKYWELSAYGGVALGGVYLASVLAGSISYGGFYKGQWGFFVPLVGPALTLGNVGDQVCPCYASQLYAYTIGSVLSIATIGALVPIILGGILTKTVPVQSSKLQLVPTVARDANGFQLVGRF